MLLLLLLLVQALLLLHRSLQCMSNHGLPSTLRSMEQHLLKLYRLPRLPPLPPLWKVLALQERSIKAPMKPHIGDPLSLSIHISWAKAEVIFIKFHQRSKESQTNFMDLSFSRVVLKPKCFLLRYGIILHNF